MRAYGAARAPSIRTRARPPRWREDARAGLVLGRAASQTRREGSEQRRRSGATPSSGATEQRSMATQIGPGPLAGGPAGYARNHRDELGGLDRLRHVHLESGGQDAEAV